MSPSGPSVPSVRCGLWYDGRAALGAAGCGLMVISGKVRGRTVNLLMSISTVHVVTGGARPRATNLVSGVGLALCSRTGQVLGRRVASSPRCGKSQMAHHLRRRRPCGQSCFTWLWPKTGDVLRAAADRETDGNTAVGERKQTAKFVGLRYQPRHITSNHIAAYNL